MSPENLPLTLVFLDDQPAETLEALHEELLTVSAHPFSLTFSELESFRQVLAVGVTESTPLVALHQRVQAATRRAGIMLPRRRFRPHMTIARLKSGQRVGYHQILNACAMGTLPNMQVTGFTLRPDHCTLLEFDRCCFRNWHSCSSARLLNGFSTVIYTMYDVARQTSK